MDLAGLQRRLRRLFTASEGVAAALAEAGDPQAHSLRDWVRGDERASALVRLEVYANAYFLRIRDALAEDFGALAGAIGEVGFHDLVTAYLLVHPPHAPSLRHAGAALSGFLAEDPAAAPFRRRWPWAADLALLEAALGDAFDAADTPPLRRADLAALRPEHWSELAFALHPATRILALDWPVEELYAAFGRGEPLVPPLVRRGRHVAVWRRDELARFRALDPLDAALLTALRDGARFGALCVRAAADCGEEAAAARVAALLAGWVDEEMLVLPALPAAPGASA